MDVADLLLIVLNRMGDWLLGIVWLNYNGSHISRVIRASLRSLGVLSALLRGLRVVAVDNGSSD